MGELLIVSSCRKALSAIGSLAREEVVHPAPRPQICAVHLQFKPCAVRWRKRGADPSSTISSFHSAVPVRRCGTVAHDETWTPDDISGRRDQLRDRRPDRGDPEGGPGIFVKSKANQIEVERSLEADGTAAEPVTFNSGLDGTVGGDIDGPHRRHLPCARRLERSDGGRSRLALVAPRRGPIRAVDEVPFGAEAFEDLADHALARGAAGPAVGDAFGRAGKSDRHQEPGSGGIDTEGVSIQTSTAAQGGHFEAWNHTAVGIDTL